MSQYAVKSPTAVNVVVMVVSDIEVEEVTDVPVANVVVTSSQTYSA
jgi:hypothetical protein